MVRIDSSTARRWISGGMVVLVVILLSWWWFTRDTLPDAVVILTGEEQGQYHKIGSAIADSAQRILNARTQFEIELTVGSTENFEKLMRRKAPMAIVQGGAVPIEDVTTITPLYLEIIHVIVRKQSDITSIRDLAGRNVSIGPQGSGSRASALKVLKHYDVNADSIRNGDSYFGELISEDSELDGAIVTAGIQNQDLINVLATDQFRLLEIDSAAAIQMTDPYLQEFQIPKGLYDEEPALPTTNIRTLATPAYLVAKSRTHPRIVDATLAALYEDNLRIDFPNLITRSDAPNWVATRLHPSARHYFYPADQLGFVQSVLESVIAVKEILLALAALVYLAWQHWKKLLQREAEEQFSKQKEYLDRLLGKTLKIESELVDCNETSKLARYLREVTEVKVDALREFTDEELRSDSTFIIFIQQCDSLLNMIQLKMNDR